MFWITICNIPGSEMTPFLIPPFFFKVKHHPYPLLVSNDFLKFSYLRLPVRKPVMNKYVSYQCCESQPKSSKCVDKVLSDLW